MEKYLGIILLIVCIVISTRFKEEYKVLNFGKEIEVKVLDVPINCMNSKRKTNAYFQFEYLGKKFTKNIEGKYYCEIIKPNIELKLLTNNDNSVFMFPDENLNKEIYSTIILFLFGLFMTFKNKFQSIGNQFKRTKQNVV